MRKLASIQKISDIQPIEGADAIEKAQVGGWWVVTAKADQYKVGDLVIYCEVDSWIPNSLAPFLSKGQEPREYNGVKGERLRTVKLRGQISQGLILPVNYDYDSPPWIQHIDGNIQNVSEGQEVSDVLGIQKWEAPIPANLAGVARGNFPTQIPRTDQERCQNLSREIAEWWNDSFEVTEKLEGSSCTMAMIDGEFHVCSRNLDLTETEDNTLWKLARENEVEAKLRKFGIDDIAIQGEVVGEGVQGNIYKIKGQKFYVYDIYDIRAGQYMSSDDRQVVTHQLELLHVPVLNDNVSLSVIAAGLGITRMEALLSFAEGKSKLFDAEREGVVFKRIDGKASFKAVSNKYLLKHGN